MLYNFKVSLSWLRDPYYTVLGIDISLESRYTAASYNRACRVSVISVDTVLIIVTQLYNQFD